MKRSSYQACNRQRLASFALSALSILLFVSYASSVSAQEIVLGSQPEAKQEKPIFATLKITNRCPQPHQFRVTSDLKNLRLKQKKDAILIGASSSEDVEVLFDASGSNDSLTAVVECLDCNNDEGCSQDPDEVSLEITDIDTSLKSNPPGAKRRNFGLLSVTGPNDVGIIPENSAGCPAGSEHIFISMDDQDDVPGRHNISSVNGWTGDISRYSTGTKFGFCRVDGSQFTNHFSSDYAVLQLSSNCPVGSISVERIFDNENKNNHNTSSGNIAPSCITYDEGQHLCDPFGGPAKNPDTKMNFCFFQALSGGLGFPNLHVAYGVFAAPSSNWFATGTVLTDDEDDRGTGNFDSTPQITNFSRIVYGTDSALIGRNTKLLVAKVANADCPNPCPFIGSYDGANCFVGRPPTGTTAIVLSIPFGFHPRFFSWTPGSVNCPTWFDGTAPCAQRAVPLGTIPFIFANNWYVNPVCRP
ncbi:MAG TPA: hypothetical protein VN937_02230 [Blastocatellia bacterium]|nr:hypothetical protein [Blastocatellia bacterium]